MAKTVVKLVGVLNAWLWDAFVNGFASSAFIPIPVRSRFYRLAGLDVSTSGIRSSCRFLSQGIIIGDGFFVNHGCTFAGEVTIGEGCALGMNVTLCSISHHIGPSTHRAGKLYSEPIAVGDGVWIGMGVIILPGVTVGAGSIIGAGSVVTRDCDPNSLYLGTPAKKIRTLSS